MIDKQRNRETIFNIIDEVNEQLPHDARIDKSVEPNLLGGSSVLDSMGIVFLIVATENKFKEEFAVEVKLTNDDNIFRENNPLRTVGTFIDYVSNILTKEHIEQ